MPEQGKQGCTANARIENLANCCALDAAERRRQSYGKQSSVVDRAHPAKVPFYSCLPVHPSTLSTVQVLVCVTCTGS